MILFISLIKHLSKINILLKFSHLRNIDQEFAVFELVEHHLFRLLVLKEITCVHESVPVDILCQSDRVFSCLDIWENKSLILILDCDPLEGGRGEILKEKLEAFAVRLLERL